jgi:hypothetical protein
MLWLGGASYSPVLRTFIIVGNNMERRYPKPTRRARRRVETPSGTQGQVD